MVAALEAALPERFRGYPVRLRHSHEAPAAPPRQRVEVHTARRFFAAYLGFDPTADLGPDKWLTTPEQTLLELTAGAVYHDDLGELTALRARLAYYPRDVWLYRMAAQWQRVAQQEAFMGRAGDVGDEIGSALVATGIVRDLMRLCFSMERRYAPYSKWFGTAFAQLRCAPALTPILRGVLLAAQWHERETRLAEAYAAVVALHNALEITAPIEATVSRYYDRPYLVIHADHLAGALRAAIEDPALRALPLYGGVDQLSDSTDFLGPADVRQRVRALYARPR